MSLVQTLPPFGIPQSQKENILLQELVALTELHRHQCQEYRRILERNRAQIQEYTDITQIPFLPVRLFKHLELSSVSSDDIVKTVTSSGTSGQSVSKIFLDKETSASQIKALVKILQSFIGVNRAPMIIIDHPGVIKDRNSFSARGAGILGVSNFGFDHTYVLMDNSLDINFDLLDAFLSKHRGKPILLFGFTFMVWKYFLRALETANRTIDLENGLLLHSGGWKKLASEYVDNQTFKQRLGKATGLLNIHNFYGMAEQVGTIYVECKYGRLHTPAFSDVIVRDAETWNPLDVGSKGLVQVLSVLPRSYPGHSLLTEDIGEIIGIDDCQCGRLGKTIKIHGRISNAEVRGCSDTHH
jgi:phenylacetate-coenzyme A ligase PaaK-like adenylate-forming protein